jgi:hypothetical protein
MRVEFYNQTLPSVKTHVACIWLTNWGPRRSTLAPPEWVLARSSDGFDYCVESRESRWVLAGEAPESEITN